MIKNYLLIAVRSLKKNFAYSIINILGLAFGLAAALSISLWIKDELSFDGFHTELQNIYRVSVEFKSGEMSSKTNVSPAVLLPGMLKDIPEIKSGVRLYNPASYRPISFAYGENIFEETRVLFADSSFFEIFSFQLLQGDPTRVLSAPLSIVLTEGAAKKYFGNEDPINKTLLVNANREYLVTGIVADAPRNSHIQFDFIISFHSLSAAQEDSWGSANYQTYILTHAGLNENILEKKITDVFQLLTAPFASSAGFTVAPVLMKASDIYLHSNIDSFSDIRYVYIFSAIALLILFIASINYVNLATARASSRAKEVGLRKVMGAFRKQLIFQFIAESALITFCALVFALAIVYSILPIFNNITGKEFTQADIFNTDFVIVIFSVLAVVSLLAGLYPAIIISKFNPAKVLKGNFKNSAEGVWLRKSLVVFQFVISAVLIVCTMVVSQQLDFIQNKKLGYSKENIIRLPYDQKMHEVYEGLYAELSNYNFVYEVARAGESPVNIRGGYTIFMEGMEESTSLPTTALAADIKYLDVFEMTLSNGKNFTATDFELASQEAKYSFILNQSAAEKLMLNEDDIIGKRMSLNGREGEIIGVVNDFHFASMHKEISPLVIFPEASFNYLFIKLQSNYLADALGQLKSTWHTRFPHRPFEYTFVDEQFQSLYTKEMRTSQLFSAFAVLAIVIACLGLFGLISYSANQRAKEFSVRKVLGANVSDIVFILMKEYTQQIIAALCIGIPLAYWLMHEWLSDFSYRIQPGFIPAVYTVSIALILTFITLGTQAWKTATANPANSLRNE
ncbi:MAG TPA: ABC transporter permease [Cyclobacteriaceae bacterium]|nr:ABC transporter permease [Cyclobacteriaceae bacterium]